MIAGEARVRDAPRETGARVPAPRVDGWKIFQPKKYAPTWNAGGAPGSTLPRKTREGA